MPSTEKVRKSELTGALDSFLDDKRVGEDDDVGFLTILEFVDRYKLLPGGLYPVQKFILKLYYNLPLDDFVPKKEGDRIRVSRDFRDNNVREMSEVEYLRHLYNQGRCNIEVQDEKSRRELILVLGRRSGKSLLASIVAAYELYRLLRRGDPQGYYGMPSSSEIRILDVANDKEQAGIVFEEVSGHVGQVDYFKSSKVGDTKTFLKFRTRNDAKIFSDEKKSTITATFKSSVAKGLRGRGVICMILDELAFFIDDGKCGRLSNRVNTEFGLLTLSELLDMCGADRGRTGWHPANFTVIQESGIRGRVSDIYYGGMQDVLDIVTRSGYSIGVSPEHRLKVMSPDGDIVWKYARDLRDGDYVGLNRVATLGSDHYFDCSHIGTTAVSANKRQAGQIHPPRTVDETFGEFLGILVGDGTWRSKHDPDLIDVTGGCEQFRPHVEALFMKYLGSFKLRRKRHEPSTCSMFPWSVTKRSKMFRDFLDGLGYRRNATKATKSVPWVVFRSPPSVIAAFLRGLFETDGGLERDGSVISMSTASKLLAQEVQLFLLGYGVTASVSSRLNKKYGRSYWTVCIIGFESRRIFCERIDFISERKRSLLRNGLMSGRDAYNNIPHQYSRLRRIIKSVPPFPSRKVGTDLRSSVVRVCGLVSDKVKKSNLSYTSARRLIDVAESVGADPGELAALRDIVRYNYFWDPVSSITTGRSEVADLRVRDDPQYVAQGFTNHNSSAQKVYKALSPSAKQFTPKDPRDKRIPVGPTEARIISISSPDAKEGFFYRLYLRSLSNSKASSQMLMIQAPTWEVNPTLSQEDYEVEHAKDPREFMTEYGAQFSDRVRGWIENAQDLFDCVIENLRPYVQGRPRDIHFAGLDFGIVNDGTSISLTHLHNGRVELAYHESWYAGRRWDEVNPHLSAPLIPYARLLQEEDRLDIDEIVNWLLALSKRFYILNGVFDQYAGPIFEQKMHKVGLTQFAMRRFSTADSSQAYRNAKMMMWTQQLALYDYPRPESSGDDKDFVRHSPHVVELLELQATSGGKNIQIVEAPDVAGKHDDFSDGFVRSLLLAAEYLRDNPMALEMTTASARNFPLQSVYIGYHQYQRTKARFHGPPPRERTIPGKYGRR